MTASLGGEYPIGRFSGMCSACGGRLEPGEAYYAVLSYGDGEYVREDYHERCWKGGAEGAIGLWRAKVPEAQREGRRRVVPSAVLMEVFESLAEAGDEDGQALRFVLALLLVRRRRLKHVGTNRADGVEVWQVVRPGDDRRFEVICPALTEQDAERLSQRVADLLAGLEEQVEALGPSEGRAPGP